MSSTAILGNEKTPNIIKTTTTTGEPVEFYDEVRAQGGMKDVMFSPTKQYVVAFYRGKPDVGLKERLELITQDYRNALFNEVGGAEAKKSFCWPTGVVEHNGRLGVVVPFYAPHFFFEFGSTGNDKLKIKGKEKEGKWFTSAHHREKNIDPRELGDWRLHLKMCLKLSRAIRRMHMAGLSHSDLSYKNCLVDPTRGEVCIIDIDGLVVPGKLPPQVVGTADFIAPEVVETTSLPLGDPNKVLPNKQTDLHALAVLIYQYLLYRHPLEGSKVHHPDPNIDNELATGKGALFIEHPTDHSNRIDLSSVRETEKFWKNTEKVPCSITGPYLEKLFNQAFIDGLHNPLRRPSAGDWEDALIKTTDILHPCKNPDCAQKWFPVRDSDKICPFCGTDNSTDAPVLNYYLLDDKTKKAISENRRMVVYHGCGLFKWHLDRSKTPNEKLKPEDQERIGYIIKHQGQWVLVNEKLDSLYVYDHPNQKTEIRKGQSVVLKDRNLICLPHGSDRRLLGVQFVNK